MAQAQRDDNRVTTLLGVDEATLAIPTLVAVSSSNKLLVETTVGSITGIADGVKTVATAGTDEAIAGSTTAKEVTVQAMEDNTGLIAVGGTGVDATSGSGTGVILYAGDSITLKIDNLADVFVDSTVSGEKVRFLYLT